MIVDAADGRTVGGLETETPRPFASTTKMMTAWLVLRLAEEGKASYEVIDRLLESKGFKMGPFKLMDLIGNDVNLAVSQSLYDACDHAERFKPSVLQKDKVAKGELGKKSGKGFYEYK